MSTTTGEIQPIASGPWVAPENQQKEVPSIQPVGKTEGGSAGKVGDFRADNGANFANPAPEFSPEAVEQIQAFLKENMGIELNFIANGDGKTVVQVLDSNTGKVIRQIPQEKVRLFQDKIEELRGILFDGKA